MGRTWDAITPELRAFIERQHLFFVATAPLSSDGHVNLSPKGHDTLRVLDDRTVAYLDLTGSGKRGRPRSSDCRVRVARRAGDRRRRCAPRVVVVRLVDPVHVV